MSHYIPNPSLKNADKLDVLRLIRSDNIGPMTFFQLVKFCGSVTKAIEMAPEMSRRGGRKKPIHIIPKSDAERELSALKRYGAELVLYGDATYPRLLQLVPDAPPAISVLGHTHLLSSARMLGVVGARNASANGCMFTKKLVADTAKAGTVIVSGLARGIDTAAHQASLASGTIAVIAGGIDSIYPPENEALYHQIREQGAIIAEAPYNSKPLARHFPARNRIIAGMSQGTLVVEASLKSGSLITAQYALDYNRDVFAVPGSPMDPRCHGTNQLLRDGAHLVQNASDVLAHLREDDIPLAEHETLPLFSHSVQETTDDATMQRVHATFLQALSYNPIDIDNLLSSTAVPAHIGLAVLLELELAGRIVRMPGSLIALKAGEQDE